MLNPITASRNIQEEFTDYILTLKPLTDKVYMDQFKKALLDTDAVAKGPFLEITDLYKTGKSLHDLILSKDASPMFSTLENITEDGKKELQILRPLYLHQEEALKKVNDQKNIIVTTGTGSGKTECFMIPILNSLLQEEENKTLEDSGVRAILIYPMNALANDQMKRLRALLKDHPSITFGIYNGDTKRTQDQALLEFQRTHKNPDGTPGVPQSNEMISRDAIQQNPPHILVTNYAMLEYMMLRPDDKDIFGKSKLRFLVLDEAHVYKGATGIETSLLLSRLKARISNPEQVIHILTSATLGGPEENEAIVRFGEVLCNSKFYPEDIVRSETQKPVFSGSPIQVSPSLFAELNSGQPELEVLHKAGYYPEPDQNGKVNVTEFLYNLCLDSTIYRSLRKHATTAKPLSLLAKEMNIDLPITKEELVEFIAVSSRVSKNRKPLLKARYHTFIKALEGAYVTIGKVKKLSLKRKETHEEDGQKWQYFEACVCSDCGRLGVIGREEKNHLVQTAVPSERSFYLIMDHSSEDYEGEESSADGLIGKDDYLLCPHCGTIVHANAKSQVKCGHNIEEFIPIHKVQRTETANRHKCPSCPQGIFNPFYLGYDAATAVLATSLLEELPQKEVIIEEQQPDQKEKKSLFRTAKNKAITKSVSKVKQFLAFSDNRSEAAFFASYMEKHYQEFLRRRGIWHIMKTEKPGSTDGWEIEEFVEKLTSYFDTNRTFAKIDDLPTKNLTEVSKRQAWIAVLQEMVNSKSNSNSLTSLGLIRFHFKGNTPEIMESVKEDLDLNNLSVDRVTDLFDSLAFDFVHNKALQTDYNLSNNDKEYIYYTVVNQYFKKLKNHEDDKNKRNISSWIPYTNKNNYKVQNSRVRILKEKLGMSETEAEDLLDQYWDLLYDEHLIKEDKDSCYFTPTESFMIAPVSEEHPSWICSNCGKVTPWNIDGKCSRAHCHGDLKPYTWQDSLKENHYAKLYDSNLMSPFYIHEHTAQLSRDEARNYQEMFIKKKLNALSCSTTFEMGVDVGDLETVYLRNVPPSPANYVQRAGRAGRSLDAAAFSLTYAKLSSHDFTYYNNPQDMITGKISVPVFAVENEKIILRHIFAIALSSFFRTFPEFYANNDADPFLNDGGYEKLKSYLKEYPECLDRDIKRSIPKRMHDRMGINDHSWITKMIGSDEDKEMGVLQIAVLDYEETVKWYEDAIKKAASEKNYPRASLLQGKLQKLRKSKQDKADNPHLKSKKQLIEFLVRSNTLPKYGFPVDTVSLKQAGSTSFNDSSELNLVRDLQLAISEYAPGAKIIANNKMFTSRFIRKPIAAMDTSWETYYIAKCPSCKNWNYSIIKPEEGEDLEEHHCKFCNESIPRAKWSSAIEPRLGFEAEPTVEEVPWNKPDKTYRSDDYYIGDIQRGSQEVICYQSDFQGILSLTSSTNDSLMVVCEDDFYVCHRCGYSISRSHELNSSDKKKQYSFQQKHTNSRGNECTGQLYKHKLCHIFKTDVVKIDIKHAPLSINYNMMLSTMYALLEAASKVLDIERTDIKGCLHNESNGSQSIILYDAVAGGAGHVRRIVSENGKVLEKIIAEALHLTEDCTCSPSCYNCLRSYYNQQFHDKLDRKEAAELLRHFIGELHLVPNNEEDLLQDYETF